MLITVLLFLKILGVRDLFSRHFRSKWVSGVIFFFFFLLLFSLTGWRLWSYDEDQ